jgi:hypothetical protein
VLARNTSIVVVGIVFALSGCGGSDDGSTTASTTAGREHAAPEAAGPAAALLPALEHLGTKGSCAEAVKLINPADLPEPTGGANPRNCASLKRLLTTLRVVKADDSTEFGTAAVVDVTVGGKQAAFGAALDATKNFKLLGVSVPRHEVGTKPRAGVHWEAPADAFVKALRAGDCKAAHAVLAPFSRLAYRNEKEFCSVFKQNFLAAPSGLGARLHADPAAAAVDLGGTRDFHFFGLATEPSGYRTIVVGTLEGGGARVTDVVPVER